MFQITDSHKTHLKDFFKEKGLTGSDPKGRYVFSDGTKETGIPKALKHMGFPESATAITEIAPLVMAFILKKADSSSLVEVFKEYCDETHVDRTIEINTDYPEVEDSEDAEDATSFIRTLVPAINLNKGHKDKLILLDPHKDFRPVLDIDPDTYLQMTERTIPVLMANEEVKKVFVTFDPYVLKSLFVKNTKSGSLNTWHVNYYIPPRWRFVGAEPKYGGLVKTLIDHLFPIESDREYVLDWLHYALVSRNDTVLCLIGSRGTGKGILLKDILGNLIGQEYREIVNQEILTDKFNNAFKNRRFVFFDEVNVSGDRELNKFKAFCNSTIALESKGMDSETIDNYTSIGLSSNDKKDFKAEPQERRFSVPLVTSEPLLNVIEEEVLEGFVKDLENPESEILAEFGEWLLLRKPKHSSRKPLKGEYFFDLCRLSMPEWKTFMIEYIINEGVIGEPLKLSNISKKFKKVHGDETSFVRRRGTVETFLGDYFHKGSHRMGTTEDSWDGHRGRDTFVIIPDEGFLRAFGNNYKPDVEAEFNALDEL